MKMDICSPRQAYDLFKPFSGARPRPEGRAAVPGGVEGEVRRVGTVIAALEDGPEGPGPDVSLLIDIIL